MTVNQINLPNDLTSFREKSNSGLKHNVLNSSRDQGLIDLLHEKPNEKPGEKSDRIVQLTNGVCDLSKDAVRNASKTFVITGKGLKDTFLNWFAMDGTGNIGVQKVSLMGFTVITGLLMVTSAINLLKSIFSGDHRKSHSPTIFTALKLILASLLTTGAYRHLRSENKFLDFRTLGLGALALGVVHSLTAVYENPNSIATKIFKLIGMDGTAKSLMNIVSMTHSDLSALPELEAHGKH